MYLAHHELGSEFIIIIIIVIIMPFLVTSTRCRPQHSTAQHSTAQHSTAQHSTAQHSTAQHSLQMPPGAAHLEIMDCILLIGSPPKGNQDGVLPPGYKALGVGQGVPHQLKVVQVVQLHCCLFWHIQSLQYKQKDHICSYLVQGSLINSRRSKCYSCIAVSFGTSSPCSEMTALSIPKMSVLTQKHHP